MGFLRIISTNRYMYPTSNLNNTSRHRPLLVYHYHRGLANSFLPHISTKVVLAPTPEMLQVINNASVGIYLINHKTFKIKVIIQIPHLLPGTLLLIHTAKIKISLSLLHL